MDDGLVLPHQKNGHCFITMFLSPSLHWISCCSTISNFVLHVVLQVAFRVLLLQHFAFQVVLQVLLQVLLLQHFTFQIALQVVLQVLLLQHFALQIVLRVVLQVPLLQHFLTIAQQHLRSSSSAHHLISTAVLARALLRSGFNPTIGHHFLIFPHHCHAAGFNRFSALRAWSQEAAEAQCVGGSGGRRDKISYVH